METALPATVPPTIRQASFCGLPFTISIPNEKEAEVIEFQVSLDWEVCAVSTPNNQPCCYSWRKGTTTAARTLEVILPRRLRFECLHVVLAQGNVQAVWDSAPIFSMAPNPISPTEHAKLLATCFVMGIHRELKQVKRSGK